MKREDHETIQRAKEAGMQPSEIAHTLLTRDLVEVALSEIKKLKQPWAKLKEKQQDEIIESLNASTISAVTNAVAIIASRAAASIPITIKNIGVDNMLKVVGEVRGDTPHRHALVDSVKNVCLLVLAPNDYAEALDSNKSEKDQPDLPLSPEQQMDAQGIPTGSDELPNDLPPYPGPYGDGCSMLQDMQDALTTSHAEDFDEDKYGAAVKLVLAEQSVTADFLVYGLGVSANMAGRFIKQMELDGYIAEEDDMGSHAVFQ